MKELSIVYQSADYAIRYEKKRRLTSTAIAERNDYVIFFDDARLNEQFGNPFEFSTLSSKIKLNILLPYDSAAWYLADVIIKAIAK